MIIKNFWSYILLSNNWNIAKKIGYGYTIAIGIAVLGGAIGLALGDYYQRHADHRLHWVHKQQKSIKSLETTVLNIRYHPQQLLRVLEDEIWFEYEKTEFLSNITRLHKILEQLDTLIGHSPDHTEVLSRDFIVLKQEYIKIIEVQKNSVESLWESIDSLNLKSEQISAARLQIIDTIIDKRNSKTSLIFELLHEDLVQINELLQKHENEAIAEQINAKKLRLYIILGSFGMAIILAILLAWRTSQTIARPLEVVTEIAREVTRDSNFTLRAPIATQDEVGILANSLNQLIAWVEEYTQELEHSQANLERRVEERTQELQDTLKNLQNTQTQLIQTEKMSSLGQMVAGIAHEINNPVNFIHGNLTHFDNYIDNLFELIDILQEHTPENIPEVEEAIEEIDLEFLRSDIPELLKSIKFGSDRIKEIVLSLRNFSRLDEASMKKVDIHQGIESTLTILNNRLNSRVEIVKKYGDIPLVACYPAQLNQVFMNLISNALDAIEEAQMESGQIIITTEKVVGDRSVKISFRDTGPGMPADIQAKIFDPFFTTKPIGKGTGLGLGICFQILQKHKATIDVRSEIGQGTEFLITLPIQLAIQ